MSASEVRDWIGKYFLYVLGALGGYIYLFAETALLPMQRAEAYAAGETIIPVFLGQVIMMYRWFFLPSAVDNVGERTVPAWLIKGPPLMSIALMVAAVVSMVAANQSSAAWSPDPETFRRIVVFVVSLLNVTTMVVIGRYFGDPSVGDAKNLGPDAKAEVKGDLGPPPRAQRE